MSDANDPRPLSPSTLEGIVINGDLKCLSHAQKMEYYNGLCARLGLDPATQPFRLLMLNGKQILYADRGCAAQLNRLHGISHQITMQEKIDDVYVVSDRATDAHGRYTEEIGAASIAGLKGEALGNAIMKARTKAMRRATLTHVGLGMLDELEVDTIPGAQKNDITQSATRQNTADAPPAPGKKWTEEEIALAEAAVYAFGDTLCDYGRSPEDAAKITNNVRRAIADPETPYDRWMDRFVAWSDATSKKYVT